MFISDLHLHLSYMQNYHHVLYKLLYSFIAVIIAIKYNAIQLLIIILSNIIT